MYQTISMYPDNQLNYETTIDLVQKKVLGINSGTYDVNVSYDAVTSTTSFLLLDMNNFKIMKNWKLIFFIIADNTLRIFLGN